MADPCDGCPYQITCQPATGPADAKLVVLGEAPYPDETEPFTSKAGAWFRTVLEEAGINPAKLEFTNTVACTPVDAGYRVPGRDAGYRPPNHDDVKRCANRRDNALRSAKWVLLAGNVALQAFRPDLTISKARGRVFAREPYEFDGQLMFAVMHPAGALRLPRTIPQFKADVAYLLELARDPMCLETIPQTCVVCGDPGYVVDAQLIPYCREHWRG